jgi:hypothetical protein
MHTFMNKPIFNFSVYLTPSRFACHPSSEGNVEVSPRHAPRATPLRGECESLTPSCFACHPSPRGTYTYKTLVSAPLGVQVKMKFPSERGARRAGWDLIREGWDLINAYFYEQTYLQLQCLSHPVTLRMPPLSEGNEPLTP